MHRRALLLACALAIPPAVVLSPVAPLDGPPPAAAGVSVLVSLEDLVARSTFVVVGTAGEHYSLWEELPSGRRIVTYTKVTIERAVVGVPGSEIWVRTLGGAVDKIGQAVSGEAQFEEGATSLVFAAQVDGVTVVTSMAQGHYPIVKDEKGQRRLSSSRDVGALVRRRGPTRSAHEALLGTTVDEAVLAVQQARRGRNDKK